MGAKVTKNLWKAVSGFAILVKGLNVFSFCSSGRDSSSKHKNRQLLKLPVLRMGLLNCSTVALVFHTEAGGFGHASLSNYVALG